MRSHGIKSKPELSQSLLGAEHVQPTREVSLRSMNPAPKHRQSMESLNTVSSVSSIEPEELSDDIINSKEYSGYDWDLVFVLPNPDGTELVESNNQGHHLTADEIVERLHIGGLETYSYYSSDKSKIIIKIRAKLTRLMKQAEDTEFVMRMDDQYLRTKVDDQDSPINDDPSMSPYSPYEFIYSKYVRGKPMFKAAHGYRHPFSSIIRVKLLLSIIQSDDVSCCYLNLKKLELDGSILGCFPLHDEKTQRLLTRSWFGWGVHPWEQPIDEVKEYFGEKVALYFEFVGHYTTWLVPLAIGGVLVSLDIAIEAGVYGSFGKALISGYTIPFFCIFVSFWAQFMLEYWKRKQVTKSMEWGTTEFEEQETDRPEFFGDITRSAIDGKRSKYYPTKLRFQKQLYSYFIIGLMMLLVIGCVSAIFYAQYYMSVKVDDDDTKNNGNTVTSIASAIQIQILSYFYNDIAKRLTDDENHRTDTDYDDALIAKLFVFSFINSYASLFFVAFIKSGVEPCVGTCMLDLAYQLTIIFATKITVDKVQRLFTVVIMNKLNERAAIKASEEAANRGQIIVKPSKPEQEFFLESYDPAMGTLEDYAEMAVQYGYVTLFVAACPIAPLLAYISNWIEIRADGYRLLCLSRRTIPIGAEDIGTWLSIFQLTSLIAVITNAGIVCYTMQLIHIDGIGRVWLFAGFQYFILIAMGVFAYIVDDVPEEVNMQLERQNHLAELAHMSEDERQEMEQREKEHEAMEKHHEVPHFEIHANDT